MPIAMQFSSATVVNLSLLTADFYSLLCGIFLFHYKVSFFACKFSLLVRFYTVKITPREKRRHAAGREKNEPFLAWGDFHAHSRFARSTIPKEKWGTTRSLVRLLLKTRPP